MMYYSRIKLFSVISVCLIGLMLCVPNFVRKPVASIPWPQIHLGLDLRGGSYLLMQVDLSSLTHDRLQSLADSVRQSLLTAGLGYRNIALDTKQGTFSFQPRDPSEKDRDFRTVNDMPRAVADEFTVTTRPDGAILLTLSPDAMKTRARDAVTQAIEIVRRRIDATGAVDPEITRQGEDRIIVELPGISDPQHIKALLGTTARMTFRLVDETPAGSAVAPPGDTLLPLTESPGQTLAVRDHIDVDGADLVNAGATTDDQSGGWAVSFTLNSVGTRAFASVTQANVGRRFAIVLDNKVIEAPVIRSAITGGSGIITGNFDARKATDLGLLLRAGALPVPLTVIEERSIGPSLGADSIRAGALSLMVGFLLVIVFMALFYGRFGWYANIALFANVTLMLAILSLFGATLTLPGMAGMLLTLGMAVDANILIVERIREELGRGRTALAAMQAGFERATGTILDSNATAFLAHVMLFVFGTGPVRGFALTITIGIATTLFTTLLLSRLLMVRWYALTRPSTLPV